MAPVTYHFTDFGAYPPNTRHGKFLFDYSKVRIDDAISFFGSAFYINGSLNNKLWHLHYSPSIQHHANLLGPGAGPKVFLLGNDVIVKFADLSALDLMGDDRAKLLPELMPGEWIINKMPIRHNDITAARGEYDYYFWKEDMKTFRGDDDEPFFTDFNQFEPKSR